MMFFETVGSILEKNSFDISLEINKKLEKKYLLFLNESGFSDEKITKWQAHLIAYIGTAVLTHDSNTTKDQVASWAKQTAEGCVQHGVGIDELMALLRSYREVIWDYIEKKISIDTMDHIRHSSVLKVNRIIDALLDQTAQIFGASYVNFNAQTMQVAKKAFIEVSFPVVALTDQVAVLPLIGELDEERTSRMIEIILPKCSTLKIEELILDLSGVPRIDTIVVNQLFQLKSALSLIGVTATFTGIRPALALPMVSLGICLNQLNVKGTLKNAISDYMIRNERR